MEEYILIIFFGIELCCMTYFVIDYLINGDSKDEDKDNKK